MATISNRSLCFTCHKQKITYLCRGCDKEFCMQHLQEHQQVLNGQLHEIINEHDQLKQMISEQKQNPTNSSLIKQIDRWEKTAIEKIKTIAQECRDTVIKETTRVRDQIEVKLSEFTGELRNVREENEFNEIDLRRLNKKLTEMNEKLAQPSEITLAEDSQTLINKIRASLFISPKRPESKSYSWKQHANTVTGGIGPGQQLNQLSLPHSIFIDQNKTLLITDSGNHRIIGWNEQTNKETIVAGGNGQGNRMDQLNQPTDVIVDKHNYSIIIADRGNRRVIRWFEGSETTNPQILIDNIDCCRLVMDNDGFLYVSDLEKKEVRRWKEGERDGTIVAGGNGEGSQLNQLCVPTHLFVDAEQSVYVSDVGNGRVMKWRTGAKEGVIVAGGNGQGNSLNQLSFPQGVLVDRWGQIYVVDMVNTRVMRWRKGEREGEIVVGGNGRGQGSDQLNGPRGLSMDDEGNLYVADCVNHRVQKFDLTLS